MEWTLSTACICTACISSRVPFLDYLPRIVSGLVGASAESVMAYRWSMFVAAVCFWAPGLPLLMISRAGHGRHHAENRVKNTDKESCARRTWNGKCSANPFMWGIGGKTGGTLLQERKYSVVFFGAAGFYLGVMLSVNYALRDPARRPQDCTEIREIVAE